MEQQWLKITGIRQNLDASREDILLIKKEMLQSGCSDLVIVPNHDIDGFAEGIFLNRLRSPWLCGNNYVQGSRREGWLFSIQLRQAQLPSFLNACRAQLPPSDDCADDAQDVRPQSTESLSDLLQQIRKQDPAPVRNKAAVEQTPNDFFRSFEDSLLKQTYADRIHSMHQPAPSREDLLRNFVNAKTPAMIEEELNQRVIGQPELTQTVADFLYYHALRQLNPELPQRPMIIAGPSGSGKTEVWRAAEALYGNCFRVKVIDASRLTSDGWKGDYKLCTLIDSAIQDGGILIADEFDKLVRPKFGGGNMNVSKDIQSEFLKVLEGEAQFFNGKNKSQTVITKKMGFVFIGAFEELRENMEQEYREKTKVIGFAPDLDDMEPFSNEISDEDYIDYGMLPEIAGRIASKCTTEPLTDEEYIQIINSPFSRVATLRRIFEMYGALVPEIPDAQIKELIHTAKELKTGVRWVSAQIENRIIASIREKGLRSSDDPDGEE